MSLYSLWAIFCAGHNSQLFFWLFLSWHHAYCWARPVSSGFRDIQWNRFMKCVSRMCIIGKCIRKFSRPRFRLLKNTKFKKVLTWFTYIWNIVINFRVYTLEIFVGKIIVFFLHFYFCVNLYRVWEEIFAYVYIPTTSCQYL